MILWRWRSIWNVLPVSLALWVAPGYAQTADRVCDPADPKSCVQVVTEGQPAPFSGVLMTGRRAAKLGVLAEGCQDRLDLAVDAAKELAAIQVRGIQAMRQNDVDSGKFQRDLLLKKLQDAEELYSPRWYERPAFAATVTAVVTVAVLAISVKTVQVLK